MSRSALLRRLGLEGRRGLVLHADDVGLCESSLRAHAQLADDGLLSSASAMVNSGWFPGVAERARAGNHDVGVHLTLNSEWTSYRLSPLTGTQASSLTDAQGYFHRLAVDTHRSAQASQVQAELLAQVLRARSHGMDVTHVDSHMLTLVHPTLIDCYLAVSRECRLPNGLVRMAGPEVERLCRIPAAQAEAVAWRLAEADEEGLLCFDAWAELPLDQPAGRVEQAKRLLDGLPEGLSLFVCHPALASDELRAVASDWQARAADHALLRDERWRAALEASGVVLLGMRDVRAAMFGGDELAAPVSHLSIEDLDVALVGKEPTKPLLHGDGACLRDLQRDVPGSGPDRREGHPRIR